MYLKRFRRSSVREALRAVREELGPDALVLSTTMVTADGWQGWVGRREVEIVAAAERDGSREVSESLWVGSENRQRSEEDAAADVAARLTATGLDPEIADAVAQSVPSASRRGASLHSLRGVLAGQLSTLASTDEDYARVEVFVGPPGAGKTTTIAKIAAQERARGGRRLGLVAADGFRVGAVEQLHAYAEILGTPFRVARNGEELDRALASRQRFPVLVDTAGRSPGDDAARELFRAVAAHPGVRTHLVIPAGTPVRATRRIFEAYAEARPSRLVLTKLDEAESLSPLVGLFHEQRLSISYLSTGQRVPEDLHRATASLLASSVLGELPALGTSRT